MEEFWKMVIQYNVKRIVTLCHKIGGRHGDADLYFPVENDASAKIIKLPKNNLWIQQDDA